MVRPGRDLSLVATMKGVHHALEAATILASEGIDIEVVDLRTVRPLDQETILESASRTSRVLAVEEGPPTGGWSNDVLALVAERGRHQVVGALRAAEVRVATGRPEVLAAGSRVAAEGVVGEQAVAAAYQVLGALHHVAPRGAEPVEQEDCRPLTGGLPAQHQAAPGGEGA